MILRIVTLALTVLLTQCGISQTNSTNPFESPTLAPVEGLQTISPPYSIPKDDVNDYIKIPPFPRPKVEIYQPPKFNYQVTDADTYFHYKFDQTGWEVWNPIINPALNIDVVWDRSSYGGYHFLRSNSDDTDIVLGQAAPPNLTYVAQMNEAPVNGSTQFSTNPSLAPYDGADRIAITNTESFTFSFTFMYETGATHPRDLIFICGLDTGSGGTQHLTITHWWPDHMYASLLDFTNFSPTLELAVKWPNAGQYLKMNQWHQVSIVWDRNSADRPILYIDGNKIAGILPDDIFTPASGNTQTGVLSDFTSTIYVTDRIWLNLGNAFGHGDPMRWAEAWMRKGTEFTPKK